MCLGTFQRLRRSLATSSVYAAVRILPEAFYIIGNAISYYIKSTVRQTVHLILCNWLPFYRPCSFASQTFIWFADFLIIAFKLMQKNWFYYTIALYCTQEKHYRFNARKQKKNSRYIYSNCSATSEVHKALTLLFPAHLHSDCSISLKLLSVFLSDSLNYLPEKTAIMSRPKPFLFANIALLLHNNFHNREQIFKNASAFLLRTSAILYFV